MRLIVSRAVMLLTLMIFSSAARCEERRVKGILWRYEDLPAAYQKAVRERKPLVVCFRHEKCPACPGVCRHWEAMAATLYDARFDTIAERAVYVLQDPDEDDVNHTTSRIVAQLALKVFPSTHVLSVTPDRTDDLAHIKSLIPAHDMVKVILRALLKAAPTSGLRPDPTWETLDKANALLAQREFAAAVALYTEVIRIDPGHVGAIYRRGLAYGGLEKDEQALADHSEAIRLDPRYFSAYYTRGVVHFFKNEFNDAIADYTQLIAMHPFAPAYYKRGLAYSAKGAYRQAIADFSEAIRMNPGFAEFYGDRGQAYRSLGQEREAARDLAQAEKLRSGAPGRLSRADVWVAPEPAHFEDAYRQRVGGPVDQESSDEQRIQEIMKALRERDADEKTP